MTPPDVKVCPACGGQGAYRDWFCPTCSRGEVVVSRALLERVRAHLAKILVGKTQYDNEHPLGPWFSMAGRSIETAKAALAELDGVLNHNNGDGNGN